MEGLNSVFAQILHFVQISIMWNLQYDRISEVTTDEYHLKYKFDEISLNIDKNYSTTRITYNWHVK